MIGNKWRALVEIRDRKVGEVGGENLRQIRGTEWRGSIGRDERENMESAGKLGE